MKITGYYFIALYTVHFRGEMPFALSFILCSFVLENWNWTSTVNNDVEWEHKDARLLKNAYWETTQVNAHSNQSHWKASLQPSAEKL